jgi:hypothetical protein
VIIIYCSKLGATHHWARRTDVRDALGCRLPVTEICTQLPVEVRAQIALQAI